jgi:hypothetical protein
MITTPTTFVLGAGAHVPYDMPSGKELTSKIIKLLPESMNPVQGSRMPVFIETYWSLYGTSGQIERVCVDFRHKLDHGIQSSIDSFLRFYAKKPGFEQIGKLAVAMVLVPMEFKMKWRRGVPEDDWLSYLFDALYKGCHESIDQFIEKNKNVSFVTFNYDRTLEHFMTIKLANTYGISRENAWDKISEWNNIIHIYGSLGKFSVSSLEVSSEPNNPMRFKEPADSIKLMYDDRDEEKTIDNAKKTLKNSQTVVFLGFAFDSDNIERLELNNVCSNKSILAATTYGLTDMEWLRIQRSMGPAGFTVTGTRLDDCLSFLRNFNVL